MARYEHLPIYKAAMDVTVALERVVAGFSRYHKYTLGTELRQGSQAVLLQVLHANDAPEAAQRLQGLLQLRGQIERLLLLMRVAKEVKAFKSFGAYLSLVEQVGHLARQNEGWLKATQHKLQPEPALAGSSHRPGPAPGPQARQPTHQQAQQQGSQNA